MDKQMTRRTFLKLSGAAAATLAVVELGFDADEAKAASLKMKTENLKPTTTICPYCSVGCGVLVYANEAGDDVVYTEGDPDHPINEGTLCSKGAALRQLYTSKNRFTKPLYRAPGSNKWEEKSWDWMFDEIADRVYNTRKDTFIEKNADGKLVNRTDSIATYGGVSINNEETHLVNKLMRAGLGLTYIEHQARL